MAGSHNKTSRQKRNAAEIIVTDLSLALQELREIEEPQFDDCFSIEEICERLGETKRNAYNIVKDCMKNGNCEYAGKRAGKGIDGRTTKTPVYRFKFKNKRRNRK